MLNDVLTFNKIKKGDIKAFESLFRQYYPALYMYGISITGNSDITEEIIQEIFYILWKDREDINIFKSVKNYLYGAVRNRSLQYLEHQKVLQQHRDYVLNEDSDKGENPLERLEYEELKSIIAETLHKMPERRRIIFEMHRYEGVKYSKIAERLDISVKTVEVEIAKALKSLRKEIEHYTYIT